jgi:hypothetical protein
VQLLKMGPRQFGREAREFFDRMWPTATVGELWGDPAGFHGGGYGGEAEDLAWMQEFGRTFGKKVKPRRSRATGSRRGSRRCALPDDQRRHRARACWCRRSPSTCGAGSTTAM